MDENKKKGQFMGSVVFIFHTSANITIGVKSAPIWPHLFMVKELQHDISPNKMYVLYSNTSSYVFVLV